VEEMSKQERLEAAIAGEPVDRPPVALWRHWPGDDRTPEGLAEATLRFQRDFDFDFVKVTPPSSYCLQDWGVRDEWRGNAEGTREYVARPVQHPEDWGRLPTLEPQEGALGAQLACLRLLSSALGGDVPLVQTVFSPLAQAKNLAGQERLLDHLRRYPDALRAGLEVITETTVRFLESARGCGIAGIFYAVQHADYSLLSEAEYHTFGRPYDLRVLQAAQGLWLNVLHLHGSTVMFDLVTDYPVQVLNWHDRETGISLAEGQRRFGGAVCGGLSRWDGVVCGTPTRVRAEAFEALAQTGGRRFILGTGCVVPVVAPWENLRAARQAVEMAPPAEALRCHLNKEGGLSCAAAFRAAQELGLEPWAVGRAADLLDIRLVGCQLGLFGYGPKSEGRHKVVKPAEEVSPDLAAAIYAGLEGGRLSCQAAWSIASRMGIAKIEVSAAAERLGVRIGRCQLGAF